ncbi:hypothetical protein [Microbulbifer variabilis]|uniref:hypothetical protein n=1 Tax=Microbulbifer variabilis TaxID=266805 RepID=UPI001CFF3023|nr:hypothetical protein [Microbulbifer variabilis]
MWRKNPLLEGNKMGSKKRAAIAARVLNADIKAQFTQLFFFGGFIASGQWDLAENPEEKGGLRRLENT